MTQLSIKISFLNKLGKGAQSGACDDLEEWDRGGKGGELKREGVCVCVCLCVYLRREDIYIYIYIYIYIIMTDLCWCTAENNTQL